MNNRPMVDKAFANAEECEKKGDIKGKEKWLELAVLAEEYYNKKEK